MDKVTESWRELANKGFRADAINACRSEEGIFLRDAVVWVDKYIASREKCDVA